MAERVTFFFFCNFAQWETKFIIEALNVSNYIPQN